MSDPGIVTVSCLLLTNDVVRDVPFHTATELLLKLPPFTVRTKPAPPAVALFGESELTDGVDGQEQETAGSKKIANAPKRGRPFIVEPRVTPYCRVAIRLPTVSCIPCTERKGRTPRLRSPCHLWAHADLDRVGGDYVATAHIGCVDSRGASTRRGGRHAHRIHLLLHGKKGSVIRLPSHAR